MFSPGDLPDSGIKPMSPALSDGLFTTEPPWKPATQCRKNTKTKPRGNNQEKNVSKYKQTIP